MHAAKNVQVTKLETNGIAGILFTNCMNGSHDKIVSVKQNFIAALINPNLNSFWGNEIILVTVSVKRRSLLYKKLLGVNRQASNQCILYN